MKAFVTPGPAALVATCSVKMAISTAATHQQMRSAVRCGAETSIGS